MQGMGAGTVNGQHRRGLDMFAPLFTVHLLLLVHPNLASRHPSASYSSEAPFLHHGFCTVPVHPTHVHLPAPPQIQIQIRLHVCTPQDAIEVAVRDTLRKAGNKRHVLNLGHGVLVGTPEENVSHMFDLSKQITYADTLARA